MKTPRTIVQVCIIAATAAALSVGVATAQRSSESKSSTLSEKDKAFMHKAAKGGMMEVAMGKVAEQNAQSDDVKSFGKRMVTDHGKANDELKSTAQKKNVELSSKEPTEKWTSDKAYMNMMVRDHQKDLAEFKQEASNGSDPDVKKFADDTAKVIQEHLDLAKETQTKLK
jgi:putative membrane protein